MNHLPILLARHLPCLRLVNIHRQVFILSFAQPSIQNFVGPRQSLCLSHVRQLSCSFTRVPQLFKRAFDQSSRVSDPDDFSRFSGFVFFIDCRARRQHHSSSVKPAFDVWSRAFAFASSPEVHFVARPQMCSVVLKILSVILRCVLSATRLWLFPSLADVPAVSLPLSKND